VRRRRAHAGSRVNWALVVPVLGGTLLAVALGMVICAAIGLLAGDGAVGAFAAPAAIVLPVSLVALTSARRIGSSPFRARDGFVGVTSAWIVAAAVGAIPFLLAGTYERPADAFFESMNGFTTNGATLIANVEAQPHAILLWRSVTQWLGGLGIVVLVVAVAPATGLATQRMFYAEMSGVTAERLTPRIAETAKILWSVYAGLTAAGFLAFLVAGMSAFDAVNHILTTIATGGFSTRTGSIGAFHSLPIELVTIVFMAAGGVNFALYWQALKGRGSLWPQLAELRAYLGILVVATAIATASLLVSHPIGAADALRDSGFTVVSMATSTGFITTDFNEWNTFARLIMVVLMFIGACAGSTAGGVKVIRLILLGKALVQDVERQVRPKTVEVLRVRGRVFSEQVRRGVLAFFSIYMLIFVVGSLVMTALGLDGTTALTSVVASLNIIGTGLGEIGPSGSYAAIPESGRWFLLVLMLAGRLEIFTVLVLLTPAFWRRGIA
jgi:trk system potassium uptake protein TrkH